MGEVLTFLTSMIRLEMVASVLLLLIAMAVIGVLGSMMWFIVTQLPRILRDWLIGLNSAIERLAESVVRITGDLANTHSNTVSANLILASHDEQARQILAKTETVEQLARDNSQLLHKIATTLDNKPCIARR